MTKEQFLDLIFVEEGDRYAEPPQTDQPTGPGGITLPVLAAWRGRPCTLDDLKQLSVAEARACLSAHVDTALRTLHFDQIRFEPLRIQLLDFGWNSGEDEAVRYLQRAIGVEADGIIGPRTIAVLNAQRSPVAVNNDVAARRAHAVYHGAVKDPKQRPGVAHRAIEFAINNTD